jgi:DUF1009 family protein
MPLKGKLGILAGGGFLPIRIAERCQKNGTEHFVIVFENQGDPDVFSDYPHVVSRLGAAGGIIKALKKQNCDQLVMAGTIRRPSAKDVRPDLWGVKFLAKTGALALGDDGLVSALVKALEGEGFDVIGADEIVPEYLVPTGLLGKISPADESIADIPVALSAARALGERDEGQAAVVRGGKIIAEEASDGTDAMLRRLAGLKNVGGVLAKTLKPNQERRVDLPTIGKKTIENAHAAGLSGIVVEAGNAFFYEREEALAMADQLGLFVIGVDADGAWS